MRQGVDVLRTLVVRARLRDEDGIALIMALGIMLVLTIVMATVISFTAAGARDAQRTNAGQKAHSLAEAGINNAVAVLQAAYDPDVNPAGVDFYSPATAGKLEPTTLLPTTTTTYADGRVTWKGTYCFGLVTAVCGDSDYGLWKLEAVGEVVNPTGPTAAPVRRTVRAKLQADLPEATEASSGLWNWVYSGAPATAPCNSSDTNNTRLVNSAIARSPIYVAGNLCLGGFATIVEPGTGQPERLVVGGQLDLGSNQNWVGCVTNVPAPVDDAVCKTNLSSPLRLRQARIVGGCTSSRDRIGSTTPLRQPCLGPDSDGAGPLVDGQSSVFVRSLDAGSFATTLPTPPVVAPILNADIPYTRSHPGPLFPCTTMSVNAGTTIVPPVFDNNTTRDPPYGSVTTVQDLTPSSRSYTCSTVAGELSWNHVSKVLTANGTLYIDGNAKIEGISGAARLNGRAAIFVSGTFLVNNAILCAKLNTAGTDCAFAGTDAWDPNLETSSALTIAAFGISNGVNPQGQVDTGFSIQVRSSRLQALLYGNGKISVGTNVSTRHQGPVVTHSTFSSEQNTEINFPPMAIVPTGTPGEPEPPATIGPVHEYEG